MRPSSELYALERVDTYFLLHSSQAGSHIMFGHERSRVISDAPLSWTLPTALRGDSDPNSPDHARSNRQEPQKRSRLLDHYRLGCASSTGTVSHWCAASMLPMTRIVVVAKWPDRYIKSGRWNVSNPAIPWSILEWL